jgi:uncharacterized RDD family membrane protein YckC
MAWGIDLAIVIIITLSLKLLFSHFGLLGAALSTLTFFVISITYGIATEWIWRGQTLGKKITRLRVMDAHGLRLQINQIFIRNLLRSVDFLPGFYLVGGLSLLFSRHSQRLGDLAANTVVVHIPESTEPDLSQVLSEKFNSLNQFPQYVARLRQRTTPDHSRLALQSIIRRESLDPDARVRLFSDLANFFKSLVPFPPEATESMPDEQYIRNLVDLLYRPRSSAQPLAPRPR